MVRLPVPHHSKFAVCHRETGVILNGMPDEMTMTDAGIWILDYKTARFTGNQDALLPVYRVQLNGYALIAETIYGMPVIGLGLVYMEPVTDIFSVEGVVTDAGFKMEFRAKLLPIERDKEIVPVLLGRAKAIYELPSPPAGRESCKDCGLLAEILAYRGSPDPCDALSAIPSR
jgi:hypothetical protein